MAVATKTLIAAVVLALVAASATACSTISGNATLFTDRVPWGCAEPFDCYIEFCSCVNQNAVLSTTCGVFANVTTATLEGCAARRVTCTLNAALNSRNVWNSSCQMWGDDLAGLYATYYADRTSTGLSGACMADMCSVVTAGNSSLADAVNYTYICSLVNFTFPAPVGRDEVAGCAASPRPYFDDMPVATCPTVASCVSTYCTCTGGVWNSSITDCVFSSAEPSAATLRSCTSAATGCFTKAALDLYVPGASPLNTNSCIAWAVPIAEDYSAYYNASAESKSTTNLWKTCNATACRFVYRFNQSAEFSSACSFTAVAGRVPTFAAYNPCPFQCPDLTCAADISSCACTANAAITGLTATPSRVYSPLDLTKPLTLSAYAAYRVASGNCSSYDFAPLLRYSWVLTNSTSTVRSSNGSVFSTAANELKDGESYTATVTAHGLVSGVVATQTFTITAQAPAPVVSITDNGATLRVPNTRPLYIKARVQDTTTSTDFAWTCTASSGTCPSLTNATASLLTIATGAAVGEYTITYTYRTSYSSSLTVTIVADEIPTVRIVATAALSLSPIAYLSTQSLNLVAVTAYSSSVNYTWSVAGTPISTTTAYAAIAASTLQTTTLTNIGSATYTWNTITVRATAANNSALYGEATIQVVVVEPVTGTLTAVNNADSGSTAVGITDTLKLTITSSPVLSALTTPFGASFDLAFAYYDTIGGREQPLSLVATPTATPGVFTTQAPLFTNATLTSKVIVFQVTLRVNGLAAAVANSTTGVTITKPDIAVALAQQKSLALQATSPQQALAGSLLLMGLMGQGTAAQATEAGSATITLVGSFSDAASLKALGDITGLAAALAQAVGTQSSKTGATTTVVTSFVTNVIASGLVTVSSVKTLMSTAGALGGQSGGKLSIQIALAATNDANAPVGEENVFAVGDVVIVTVRQSGAALSAGLSVGSGDTTTGSMKLPASLSFAGMDPDAVYGIASAVLVVNPYGTATPTGSVVSYDLTANGASVQVGDQTSAIVIVMPNGSGVCAYWAESTTTWSADGVTTVVVSGRLECHTLHLTAFGSFPSSATSVAVSALVLVLAAAMQVLMM